MHKISILKEVNYATSPLIFEYLADLAIISCHGKIIAGNSGACKPNWLNLQAFHAHHFCNRFPVYISEAVANVMKRIENLKKL